MYWHIVLTVPNRQLELFKKCFMDNITYYTKSMSIAKPLGMDIFEQSCVLNV